MDPALGAVGRVTRANPALLELLTANGFVPVVACVAGDRAGPHLQRQRRPDGRGLRDRVRGRAADLSHRCRRRAGRRGPGPPRADGCRKPELSSIAAIATGGMQAKLESALAALGGGVAQVLIAPGAARDVLPRILAGEAIGTRMVLQEVHA